MIKYRKDINTFQKLITKYNICIPVIQRDYVQGVDDSEFKYNEKFKISDKKDKFLEEIFAHLDKCSSKTMNINTIYGFIGNDIENGNRIFYPVDGQQRLTTLYLLHWYLYIRNSNKYDLRESDGDYSKVIFTYETRESAKDFFGFLNNKANNNKIQELFDNTDNDFESTDLREKKLDFISKFKNQSWFKSQWFTDTTIISVINIIGDFYTKIPEEKLEDYLKRLIKNDIVTFNLITNEDESAEKLASVDYIRINSRGKQLEFFENLKPLLEQFNEKIYDGNKRRFTREDHNFVFNYDRRYIDIFYDAEKDKDFKTIQKSIDKKTMIVMINLYNILRYVNKKKCPDLSECLNQEVFYQIIYQNSKLEFGSSITHFDRIKQFWKDYFEFLNFILNTIKEEPETKKYLKRLFEGDENNENAIIEEIELYDKEIGKKRTGNLVIYLRYIYWHFKENNNFDKKDSNVIIQKLEQLKYFLKSLRYDEWKEEYYENTELFAKCIAKKEYENVNSFFLDKDSEEAIEELEIDNIKGINDIKVRIKELCKKAKLIDYINKNINKFNNLIGGNVNFKFFKEFEERNIRNNMERYPKRSVYYLLYIAELWDSEISDEKIIKILSYKKIAEKYFLNKENKHEWRKIFAIATYYNEVKGELLSPGEINKNAGIHYTLGHDDNEKEIFDLHNLHYWDDEYYFIEDKMYKKDVILRRKKLRILKLAYDLVIDQQCIMDSVTTLKETNYDSCWLKYAVLRDHYYEKLLINQMVFRNNKVEIKREIKSSYFNNEIHYQNFFAYLYLLDREKEGWKVDIHESNVYDLTTTNVRDTKYRQKYTIYYDVAASKVINGFKLKLLWQGEKERQLYDRTFFYHKHILEIDGDSNTLISIEDNRIVKRIFNLNDYKKFYYNFGEDKKIIEEKINEENKKINNIEKLYNEYFQIKKKNTEKISNFKLHNIEENKETSLEISKLEDEIKVHLDQFKEFIKKNYNCEKSYFKNGSIVKYLYKDNVEKTIFPEQFLKNDE
ncbi:DUF262 domain-containing protein [Clostridium beijerinckii]|uniref:DUF262 domain-containing protein n=1 Tax=Clostridium beijerinckii TaxID=1520 RepID=UPI00242F59AB|nr:DUF262 domain-containing protein [Clostridium beijerinckii]MDG5855273.1 DUF262 domain-containing protein [Clostridium beijerinckii]